MGVVVYKQFHFHQQVKAKKVSLHHSCVSFCQVSSALGKLPLWVLKIDPKSALSWLQQLSLQSKHLICGPLHAFSYGSCSKSSLQPHLEFNSLDLCFSLKLEAHALILWQIFPSLPDQAVCTLVLVRTVVLVNWFISIRWFFDLNLSLSVSLS